MDEITRLQWLTRVILETGHLSEDTFMLIHATSVPGLLCPCASVSGIVPPVISVTSPTALKISCPNRYGIAIYDHS
jgi:hypothetical protein